MEENFIGQLKQTPPIYAALKMDGKPCMNMLEKENLCLEPLSPDKLLFMTWRFSDPLKRDHDYPLLRPTTEEADTVKILNANMLNDALYFQKNIQS